MNGTDQGGSIPTFMEIFPRIMLPMSLAVIDQTIVSAALPDIALTFGKVEYISWVVVGYLVAATVTTPVYGRLGDLFGRRILMLVALGIFTAASVLCFFSVSMEMLVAGRILQGCGGGGLMTLSQALIGESVPPRERASMQGYIATIAVTSNALGPILGGLLTESFGWPSIFLVNIPLGALAFVITFFSTGRPGHGEKRQFDVVGLILLTIFVTSTLVGFSQAQRFTSIALVRFSFLAGLGAAALALLVWHENRARHPLLPMKFMRQALIWRSDLMAACHGATFVSLLTVVPLYLRLVRGHSAADVGLLLIPLSVGVGLGSILTGKAVSGTGLTAIFPSIGLAVSVLAMVAVAFAGPVLSDLQLSGLLGVAALGLGTVMGVVQVSVQAAAGSRVLGAASASVQLSRSIGAALGTGLVSLVLFSRLAYMRGGDIDLFHRLFQEGPEIVEMSEPVLRAQLAGDIGSAFVFAFLTIAGFALGGMLLAWSLPVRRL